MTTGYHTIQEIAELIQQELVSCEEFKDYTSWICCESYPDPDEHEREADAIEKEWPTFKDDQQLGHIPQCVWQDREEPHIWSNNSSMDDLTARANNYTKKFNRVLQHNQARVQHHHHKKDKNSGKRRPLPACRGKKKDECKHGFPKTKLLTEKALVVCPGIAQRHGLRVSGRRNALGSILPRRNCVWINGTAPALTVAFGFNTDISPNDRLPIIKETHEASCNRSSCVKDVSTGEVARVESRAQLDTDGYFTGYMVKTQPIGGYELGKCLSGMDQLRSRIRIELTPEDQSKTVVRRMISDLELRGVLRGAPEIFNLSVNMRKEDSLFQECIRTFIEVSFPGKAFLDRLEAEVHGVGSEIVRRVARCRGPRARSQNLRSVPHVDAYGFRGRDPQVLYLSPYEFFMHWEIKRVPEPFRQNCNGWSAWTKEGEEYYSKHKHDNTFKLVPGKHYKVIAHICSSRARARRRARVRARSCSHWLTRTRHVVTSAIVLHACKRTGMYANE